MKKLKDAQEQEQDKIEVDPKETLDIVTKQQQQWEEEIALYRRSDESLQEQKPAMSEISEEMCQREKRQSVARHSFEDEQVSLAMEKERMVVG